MKQFYEESSHRHEKDVTPSVQAPWVADLEAITAQGSTDARMLFSFGQRRTRGSPPVLRPTTFTRYTPTRRPRTSYLIIATPRSGSYLLCNTLVQSNLAGRPTEYFGQALSNEFFQRWRISSYADYLEGIFHLGTTPNGVFGAKICWTEMEGLLVNLRNLYRGERLSVFALLARVFPDLHYIWITRRDALRQAISYWRASWTGEWLRLKDGKRPTSPGPAFDFQAIDSLLQSLLQYDEEIQQYFSHFHIQPFTVCYEDLVTTYQETTLQILDFLEVSHTSALTQPEPTLEKQADAWTEKMVQRYHQFQQEQETC